MVSRFDSRTSQIKKCVSRRTLAVRTASWKQRRYQVARPTTTDLLHRHAAFSKVSCIPEQLWHSVKRAALRAAAQPVALYVRLQLPRPEGLHQAAETSVFSLQMRSRFSYGQFTRLVVFEQGKRFLCGLGGRKIRNGRRLFRAKDAKFGKLLNRITCVQIS